MWYSERYLQFFAASSHSSGPADLLRRAGPGTGTLTGAIFSASGSYLPPTEPVGFAAMYQVEPENAAI